jgi:hypothetical protein
MVIGERRMESAPIRYFAARYWLHQRNRVDVAAIVGFGAVGGAPVASEYGDINALEILPRGRGKVYLLAMTKLLEQAVETVRGLSPEMQDDLARVLLQLAGKDQPVFQLSAAEEASFDESLAQADRGEFATDEEVRAIWAKHGL